ncbi:hypothetical protein GCM10023318_03680 [Nocardia callitridis]|uniref:Mini-circle protein n=1 Tax=Nocardia callitridis TaxID=648753 RepID=A0ABP9JS36_9NOCA
MKSIAPPTQVFHPETDTRRVRAFAVPDADYSRSLPDTNPGPTPRMERNTLSNNGITDGTERAVLENMLDRNRRELIDTARGLSESQARLRLVASLTTPISLIKHAAAAERIWFQRFWAGLEESECDGYSRRDEGTFTVADDETLTEVIAEYERASELSRTIAARFTLDDTKEDPGVGIVSMRWTLLMMTQEFARHAGHGDILREQITAPVRRWRELLTGLGRKRRGVGEPRGTSEPGELADDRRR